MAYRTLRCALHPRCHAGAFVVSLRWSQLHTIRSLSLTRDCPCDLY